MSKATKSRIGEVNDVTEMKMRLGEFLRSHNIAEIYNLLEQVIVEKAEKDEKRIRRHMGW